MNSRLPDELEIIPISHVPRVTVTVPGSKSITNRAMVLAALHSHDKPIQLTGVLQSEDTEVMVDCLQKLGYDVQPSWEDYRISISSDKPSAHTAICKADLYAANSGTTIRFLTAMVCCGRGRYRLDGNERMRERPIEDLLAALRQLGISAYCEQGNGCPPVVVETNGLNGGHVRIRGDLSSQYLSALLMVAPSAKADTIIEVETELVSQPYVRMTLDLLRSWGLDVEERGQYQYFIPSSQSSGTTQYSIEPDASAASYFFAAAAITGGEITVRGLSKSSLQGDVRFVEVLQQMGCIVTCGDDGIRVVSGPLKGVDVDMNDISDTVMTLAAVACFAQGPTTIRNVAHIRLKETDRLAAISNELTRVGAKVDLLADGLKIFPPKKINPAHIETYDDHRMAMSMALVGLRSPGIVIKNPACVGKTYPNFFEDLAKLGKP